MNKCNFIIRAFLGFFTWYQVFLTERGHHLCVLYVLFSKNRTLELHLVSQEKKKTFIFVIHKLEKYALADPTEIIMVQCFSSLFYYGLKKKNTCTLYHMTLLIQLINK